MVAQLLIDEVSDIIISQLQYVNNNMSLLG